MDNGEQHSLSFQSGFIGIQSTPAHRMVRGVWLPWITAADAPPEAGRIRCGRQGVLMQ